MSTRSICLSFQVAYLQLPFFCWCVIEILNDLQVSIVSVVYSQSELLQKEVFLVELVDSIAKSIEAMSHLKAIYFVRPTSRNIQHIKRQLASPRFGEYHLCKLIIVLCSDQQVFLCSLKLSYLTIPIRYIDENQISFDSLLQHIE